MSGEIERALEMAGYFAAHALWCVSDGDTLIPLLGQERDDRGRNMLRFEAEALEEGVARGQAYLETNPEAAHRAALVFDGYVTLADGQNADALYVQIRTYGALSGRMMMAIPYRPAAAPEGFAVYRPRLIEWRVPGAPPGEGVTEAFYRGVGEHEQGSAVWAARQDDSR